MKSVTSALKVLNGAMIAYGSGKGERVTVLDRLLGVVELMGENTKTPLAPVREQAGFRKEPATTYSRPVRTTIGPKCLSAVFGMGTGVSTWV